MKLIVATTNSGKLAEIREILKDLAADLAPMSGLRNCPTIVEDGGTFEENALKKAHALAEFSGCLTLADDSGLVVDALGGAPGVHSARYSGEGADDARNNDKLLRALEGVSREQRTARFVCVLALCLPGPSGCQSWLFHGEVAGQIAASPLGQNGFGYDPLFFYPPFGKTFGEVDRLTKCRISHRGTALRKLAAALPALLGLETNP